MHFICFETKIQLIFFYNLLKNVFLLFFLKRLIHVSRANRSHSDNSPKNFFQFITENTQIFNFAKNKNTQSMKASCNDNANFLRSVGLFLISKSS